MSQPLNARQIAILGQIRQNGRVFVENLASAFATTPQTIRRDLQVLADLGEAMRFHGGASLPTGVEYTGFDIRRTIAIEQKEAIGRAVAARIPDKTLVMINGGTTTAAVAAALTNRSELKVLVDNVNIANDLRSLLGVEIFVPGGSLRRSDGAIIGEAAVSFIRLFRADIAVIGAAAIDDEGALLDYDLSEALVARAMMECSRHVIIAADSSKFSRSAPVCIGHLSQAHTLVTDRCASVAIRDLCEHCEVELVETKNTMVHV